MNLKKKYELLKKKKTVIICCRIPESLNNKLKKIIKKERVPTSFFIKEILENFLNNPIFH